LWTYYVQVEKQETYFVEENLIGIFKYWRENEPGQMIQTFSKNEEIYIILKKKPTNKMKSTNKYFSIGECIQCEHIWTPVTSAYLEL
jgi:hypothetical protein